MSGELADYTKPETDGDLISAEHRVNYLAQAAALGGRNCVRDNGFMIWAAGDSTVPTHYSRQAGSGSAVAREAVTVYGGFTHSLKLTGATSASEYAQQMILSSTYFPAFLQGEAVGFGCAVYGGAADSAEIGIYDGVTTYWSGFDEGNYAANGSWSWLTLQYALNAAATQIAIRMRTAQGIVSYFCGPTLLMGGSAPRFPIPSLPGLFLLGPGTIQGDLPSSQATVNGWRDPASLPYYVQSVTAVAGTGPVGDDAIFDLNKNGTSMFATNPQIDDGATDNGLPAGDVPDSATYSTRCFAAGDKLTADVDQRGSGTYGADVVLKAHCVCYPPPFLGWFPGSITETGA